MCDINITQYGDSCDPATEEEGGEGGGAEQGRGVNTAAANTLLCTMIQSLTYSDSGVSHRAPAGRCSAGPAQPGAGVCAGHRAQPRAAHQPPAGQCGTVQYIIVQ